MSQQIDIIESIESEEIRTEIEEFKKSYERYKSTINLMNNNDRNNNLSSIEKAGRNQWILINELPPIMESLEKQFKIVKHIYSSLDTELSTDN